MHNNNNDNKQGQQKLQTNGKVPLWKKKRDEARKRKEQGQIRFVSSGVYKDGKQEQRVANGQVHHHQPATLPTTTKEVKEEPSVKKENVPVNPPHSTDSSILLISSSSERVVEHGPELSSSNTNGDGENKAGGPGWIETDRGMLVMQMMQRMGYEHGKGLGRNNQGIVEPIRAVANPGKLALGAEKKVKKNLPPVVKPMPPPPPMANHRLPIDYPMPPPMEYSNQPQSEEGDGAKYSGAKAKQMQYETQVMQTLRSAGFNQSHAEEVWQSMSVLAKHGVMRRWASIWSRIVQKRRGKWQQQQRRNERSPPKKQRSSPKNRLRPSKNRQPRSASIQPLAAIRNRLPKNGLK